MKLSEIAERLGAELRGDGDHEISAVAPIESAQPNQLTFLANQKYHKYLQQTKAGAVIIKADPGIKDLNLLLHPDPYYAYARSLRLFYPLPQEHLRAGINAKAAVASDATIADSAHLGEFVTIATGTEIGENTKVMPNSFVGRNCKIGNDCLIYPNVTIYDNSILGDNVTLHAGAVIGSDGYGYAQHEGVHYKVLQIGRVRIEADVEIGANTTIDRAAIGETVIGKGSKIDNLVQLAHNVQVGKGSLIVAQAGVSGSTKLGDYVILAGQTGLVGHINVGDRAVVAAQSGVSHDLDAGKMYSGSPARDIRSWRKIEAHIGRLPERVKELRELRRKVDELTEQLARLSKSEQS